MGTPEAVIANGGTFTQLATFPLEALAASVSSFTRLCDGGAGSGVLSCVAISLSKGATFEAEELIDIVKLLTPVSAIDPSLPVELLSTLGSAISSSANKLKCHRTVLPFLGSLARFAASDNMFWPVHLDFVKAALSARDYVGGTAVLLDITLYDVARGSAPRDVLLYHYYAGLLLCGAERWSLAVGMFKTCIGLPGPATSEVQVEAAKKILLVLCIDPSNIDQRTGDLHMNPGVVISAWPRHRREVLASQSRQYVDLSKLVAAADTAAARKLAAEQDAVFEKDGNGGLVHTAINSALPFRLLLQLRRVYTAVPLAMVATTLEELADAAGVEAVVVRTVLKWGLQARVDQRASALEFLPHTASTEGIASESALAEHMQGSIDSAMTALTRLQSADRDLQLSDTFFRHITGGKTGRGASGFRADAAMMGASSSAPESYFSGGEEDADVLMALAQSMGTGYDDAGAVDMA